MGIKHSPTTGFYPTPMTGANDSNGTITYPNGFILKWGKNNCAAEPVDTTITFATAFPNACFQAFAVYGETVGVCSTRSLRTHTITAANFKIYNPCGDIAIGRWWAVGR